MSTFFKGLIATALLAPAWTPITASAQDSCEDSILINDPTGGEETEGPRGPVSPEESSGFANDCFVGSRAAAILSNQPDLQTRRGAQDRGIYASQAGGVADTGGYAGPLWTSLGVRQSELDGSELEQGMVTFGGDIFFTDTTVFGLMLQSEASNQSGPSDISYDGTGLMGGIYAIYVEGDLAVDARIMGGRSSTDISEAGDEVDGVESVRWLAAAQVSTQTDLGGGQLLVPHASVGWFEDTMDGYTLNAVNVPETTIRYGQADLGGTWLLPITMGDADGNIIVGASGILGFGDAAGEEVPDDLRGRFDLGIELFRGNEWAVSGIVFTDGLGQDDFEAYGADLGVTIWF